MGLLDDPAAAAQIANATYRIQNNLPLDPSNPYNQQVQQNYSVQDAAQETAKYQAAFSQPRDDTRVQQSAAYNAIVAQYQQTRNQSINATGVYSQGPVTPYQNPYNPNSAAGIAWEVARTGGVQNPYLAATAIAEGMSPSLLNVSSDLGRSTVPLRDYSSNMPTTLFGSGGATVTTYVPYGEYTQEKLENTKLLLGEQTGELGVYQQPYGHSLYNLISGGSRAALQSGMFTVERAETPFVVSQEGVGSYSLPSGLGLSRLGAEAYGGFVMPLDSRTVESTKAQLSSYPNNVFNLANYVNPQGVNLSKEQAPGANIPWEISPNAPAIGYMNEKGPTGQAVVIPGVTSDRLIGGKTLAGSLSTTPLTGEDVGRLPTPFISATTGERTIAPTGEIFGYKIPVISDINAFFQPGTTVKETIAFARTPESSITEKQSSMDAFGNVVTTEKTTTTGGLARTATVVATPTPSGYDILERKAAAFLGTDTIPVMSTEQIKAQAPYLTGFAPTAAFGAALQTPVLQDYAASYFKGEQEAMLHRPLAAGVSFGAMFGVGVASRAFEGVAEVTRASFAEKAIAEGGGYRAAETFLSGAPKVVGAGLVGIYAVDVGARTTQKGTDFSPMAAERFGQIAETEVRPGLFGGMLGYAAPGATYRAVQLSDIGYKSALQEGTTAGRLDYYVKQPVTKPYEMAKIDYQAYIQEGGKPGIINYFAEKPVAPEPTTLKYQLSDTPAWQSKVAYGEVKGIGDYVTSGRTVLAEAKGKVVGTVEGIRGDYYDYLSKIEIANYQTPRQKIDAALVKISESSTGLLTPERIVMFDTITGEKVYSEWGSIYKEGRFLSNVGYSEPKLIEVMRSRGIEPTVPETKPDFSGIEIYHTHPKGTDITGKYNYLEVPSGEDIVTTVRTGAAKEGSVSPFGVQDYSIKHFPTDVSYARSLRRAGIEDTPELAGKAFAESMQRYGSGKSFQYRTIEEIKATLPEGTTLEPNLFGYAQSKVYPVYFEAKTTVPIKVEGSLRGVLADVNVGFENLRIKAAQPPSIAIKTYLQENRPFETFKTNFWFRLNEEIRSINSLYGVEKSYGAFGPQREPITPLSKTFGAVKEVYTPTRQEYKPSQVETPSKSGAVSVSRIEETAMPRSTYVQEPSYGLPGYPRLAGLNVGVNQRISQQMQEEEQYLTLPPGTDRPSAMRQSMLTLTLPASEVLTGQRIGQTQIQAAVQIPSVATSVRSDVISAQDKSFKQDERQGRDIVKDFAFDIDRSTRQSSRIITAQDTFQIPRTITTTKEIVDTDITRTRTPPPPPPPIPGLPTLGAGLGVGTMKRSSGGLKEETFYIGPTRMPKKAKLPKVPKSRKGS